MLYTFRERNRCGLLSDTRFEYTFEKAILYLSIFQMEQKITLVFHVSQLQTCKSMIVVRLSVLNGTN